MSNMVSILDYGIGNLLSVARALEAVGADVRLIETADKIRQTDRLIVPGVGAFGHCADVLARQGLTDAIREYAALERPMLGICVGMQLMLETGTEFGAHKGLGLIPGTVKKIPAMGKSGPHKIPHIGWNRISAPDNTSELDPKLFSGMPEAIDVYFLHSYAAEPENPDHRIAVADYNGCQITAAIGTGAIYGVQFHPEKSGPNGLQILENFIKL